MPGTYQKADIYRKGVKVKRPGGMFEDQAVLAYPEQDVRFTRRKHRVNREKQGQDDEDVWDVYIEPDRKNIIPDNTIKELEKNGYIKFDGEWYLCLNFRAQRNETGRLHHYSSKVKLIPPPNVAPIET